MEKSLKDLDVEDFARRISMLDKPTPLADQYDLTYGQEKERWWTGQREHLNVWCQFQTTEGFKGFKHEPNHSARRMYNNFGRPETLLWLAEAVGIEEEKLDAVVSKISNNLPASSRCKDLRKIIPFDAILELLPKNF